MHTKGVSLSSAAVVRVLATILSIGFIVLGRASVSEAATPLPSGGTGFDLRWTKAQSPYIVDGGYRAVNLEIEPGTVVKFTSGTLLIEGSFVARGSADDPIVFTCLADDSAGGDTDGGSSDPTTDTSAMVVISGRHPTTVFEEVQVRYIAGVWIEGRGRFTDPTTGVPIAAVVRNVSFTACPYGLSVNGWGLQYAPWLIAIDGLRAEGLGSGADPGGYEHGVYATSMAGFSMRNADIRGFRIGVGLSATEGVDIRDSVIARNAWGIMTGNPPSGSIANCSVRQNADAGVLFAPSYGPAAYLDMGESWWGDASGPWESTQNPTGSANGLAPAPSGWGWQWDFQPWLLEAPAFDREPVQITTSSLPGVFEGQEYAQQLTATSAYDRHSWYVTVPHALPPGLELTTDGVLRGVPAEPGSYTVFVTAQNGSGLSASAALPLVVNSVDLSPGLKGWWKFDEGSGTAAGDASGLENHGVLVGSDPGSAWAVGKSGYALDFQWDSTLQARLLDYVDVGNSPELNPTTAMTIAAWVKPSDFPYLGTLVERDGGTSYAFALWYDGLAFWANTAEDENQGYYPELEAVTMDGVITVGAWQHVAVVFDAGDVRFYVNGVDVSYPEGVYRVGPAAAIAIDTANVTIGNDKTLSTDHRGLIDDVRIYNVALTQEQVQYVMNHPDVGVPADTTLSISSVEPSSGKRGETLMLYVKGSGFGTSSTLTFGEGVTVISIVSRAPEEISATVMIAPDAGLGLRDVTVQNELYGQSTLPQSFEVMLPSTGSLIAADANRDGVVRFDGSDATTSATPFLFWLNSDRDVFSSGEYDDADPSSGPPDSEHMTIGNKRDLEDFSRIHIRTPFLATDLGWTCTLRVTDIYQGSPEFNLWKADTAGLEYLFNDADAERLVGQQVLCIVDDSREQMVPAVCFGADQVASFLFDGRLSGKAAVSVRFYYQGVLCAEDKLFLSLQPMSALYDHYTVGDTINMVPSAIKKTADIISLATEGLYADEAPYLLFVHGWRMLPWERRAFAETAYKRLWHQGYRGRFGLFSWPTEWVGVLNFILDTENFNRSERKAFISAEAFRALLVGLRAQYGNPVHVIAHSLGNVVVGEALLQEVHHSDGPTVLVGTYIATQAAIAAHTYDASTVAFQSTREPNIYAEYPMTGGTYLNGTSSVVNRMVNFYNPFDFALETGAIVVKRKLTNISWLKNQDRKPATGYGYNQKMSSFTLDSGLKGVPAILLKFGTDARGGDTAEIFSMAAPARSHALGAQPNVGGGFWVSRQLDLSAVFGSDFNFGDAAEDHSGQFRSTNMRRTVYWKAVLGVLGISPTPN